MSYRSMAFSKGRLDFDAESRLQIKSLCSQNIKDFFENIKKASVTELIIGH